MFFSATEEQFTLLHPKSKGNHRNNPRFVLENCNEVIITKSSRYLDFATCYLCKSETAFKVYNYDPNAHSVLKNINNVFHQRKIDKMNEVD